MSYFIGDTVKFNFTLMMESVPVDLTSTTITIRIQQQGGALLITDGVVTITDAAAGKCSYTMSSPFAVAGTYDIQLKINFGSGELRFSGIVTADVAVAL